MLTRAGFDRDVDVHLLLEQVAGVGSDDPRDDGAGVRIDRRRDILDRAVERAGTVARIDRRRIAKPTAARSLGAICASTQTCDRLATVNAAMEPACSSWPGVIVLLHDDAGDGRANDSATPPSDCPPRPRDRPGSTPIDDERLKRGDRGRLRRLRHRSAPARLRARKCRCARRGRDRRSQLAARWPRATRLCDRLRRHWRSRRNATAASGWPFATCWPSATKIRVTGPVNGDTTAVAWSLSKSTVPGRFDLLAVADRDDRIELDMRALRLRQPDVGDGVGRAALLSSGDDEQPRDEAQRERRRAAHGRTSA